ncbi:hypothetical protein BUALT_Bualt04G0136600 [Buddleja alternifolia]|uniref:Protein RIK n=1 Tax=Buddleja alternifolia TaxID=168488 RepID=A0AAV6XQ46_9LAMI|nr:hypothetical protein BUALT_Bualt04G0136600 [Buddleja alternifolia]
MTEDSCARVSSSESASSTTKQRKKRRWDQPDESLVSAGAAVTGIFPLAYMGSLTSITLPAVSSVSGASPAIPLSASSATPLQVVQVPLQQHAAAIIQKLIQPRIQDELIAREIVINDADSAIRYKLTKRQTQEEIQRNTGAVVITRGKYRPPNAPLDGERPLYLHISAAAHLETTAERIKAVDHAAAMVEEMLKQASVSNGVKVDHLLNTCVFMGFEADPYVNIGARIRGPNDQYVNHIMNETGATVLLRGRGSGNSENGQTEETQQPLHLLLSSNDPKSLERAKILAENLLDTISAEFGASRVSSSKVYGAVPPPPQLQVGVQIASAIAAANADPPIELPTSVKDKRSQKRKFQELPAAAKRPANPNQVLHFPYGVDHGKRYFFFETSIVKIVTRNESNSHLGNIDIIANCFSKVFLQLPKLVQEIFQCVTPPSPPPKFNSIPRPSGDNNAMHKSKPEYVALYTLTKLMEYGDDDDDAAAGDDLDEAAKRRLQNHSTAPAIPKPFWAL